MSTLLIYAIKSAILLTLLLLPGILLLFREKMFRFNRATLLSIMVLSLVLPLCNFSHLSMDEVPAVQTIEIGLLQAGFPVEVVNYEVEAEQTPFPWFYVVSILYATGVTVVLSIRLREIFSMGRIIHRGSIWQTQEQDGIRIFCHADNVAPFSWLRSIVIGEQDYRDSGREIILHEKAHILHRHSLDILLLTLVEALQWWNPFVYLLGIYLRDVHEYQADDYVLRQGVSCHVYSQLIIRKAVGASSYTFANSFNRSLTKKRITMMLNSNSNPSPWRRSRALYVIPMVALALSAFATPEFKNASVLMENAISSSVPYATKEFVLKGKIADGMDIAKLQIYTWNYDQPQERPDSIGTIEVINGKFIVSLSIPEPQSGMLRAIHSDGTPCNYFQEFMFVPGEICQISIYGEDFNQFQISGSQFYREWKDFAEFYQSLKAKVIQDNNDEAFFTALKKYNYKHANEEGCILYQYMWLGANLDFHIADDIQQGRFKKYILHRKKQYGLIQAKD